MDESLQSVTALPGVGPAKAKHYARLGIETLGDLCYHFPRGYENRGDVKLLCETPDAEKTKERGAVILTIASEPRIAMIRRGMALLKFRAFDESGTAEITYFNQNYLKVTFVVGAEYRFYGKIVHPTTKNGRYTMASPAYERIPDDESALPPFYPVYRLTEGLSMNGVQKDVRNALVRVLPTMNDPLPEEIRHRAHLCTLSYALRSIQCPEDFASLAAAKRRLIFDEFFAFSLAMGYRGRREEKKQKGAPICSGEHLPRFYAALPYRLTGAQTRVVEEILGDMQAETPMNRIVVGDVGCGKTICAAAAIFIALTSGRQAALMAPTEILARQHYLELSVLLSQFGFRVELLTGATPKREKERIYASLSSADPRERTDLVIGTHALLSDRVDFYAPGLVVTDEQHRFGVEQRATLSRKNKHAHFLVMSATPIPRSLALVLYGDLDISRIDEMPPGRQQVETFAVDERYRERLNRFIEKQVGLGGQVYVVCPAIEEREVDEESDLDLSDVPDLLDVASPEREYDMKSAVKYAADLQAALPQIPVGLMHGKMKPKDKDAVMADFVMGKTRVLVSTTVIEVGVNVPTATLMIVENAERFGLSQLHQLRGRVGRGMMKAYCVLVSEAVRDREGGTPTPAAERLSTLCASHDGFAIAEKDLLLRGPGDFFGHAAEGGEDGGTIRQSGGVKFRLAELSTDSALLQLAGEAAKEILQNDPSLESHPALLAMISSLRTDEETRN